MNTQKILSQLDNLAYPFKDFYYVGTEPTTSANGSNDDIAIFDLHNDKEINMLIDSKFNGDFIVANSILSHLKKCNLKNMVGGEKHKFKRRKSKTRKSKIRKSKARKKTKKR